MNLAEQDVAGTVVFRSPAAACKESTRETTEDLETKNNAVIPWTMNEHKANQQALKQALKLRCYRQP